MALDEVYAFDKRGFQREIQRNSWIAFVSFKSQINMGQSRNTMGRSCLACWSLTWMSLTASGHDTFLRPVDFLSPETGETRMNIYNGTYASSLDSIPEDVVDTLTIRTPSGEVIEGEYQWRRREPGTKAWRIKQRLKGYLGGMDLRRTSDLEIRLDEEGISTIGLTLHALRTALSPETFALYMEESGLHGKAIPPILTGDANQIVRERYTKTCKTLISIGSDMRGDPTLPIGQVVEIVPLGNPLLVQPGEQLEFQALLFGKPLPGQVVLAGRKPGLFNRGSDLRLSTTTGPDGKFSLLLDREGQWWVKFNHIALAEEGDTVDLVTHWATLTFIIR